MSKSRIVVLAILAMFVLLGSTQPGYGQSISGVEVVSNMSHYSGGCPAHIRFTGKIFVNAYPMTLNYQWERSDGVKGPVKIVHVPSRSTRSITAVDTWQLGAPGKRMQVSAKLRVRSGNTDLTSNSAQVTVACR